MAGRYLKNRNTLHLHYYVHGKYMNIEAHIHIEDKLFCTSIQKVFLNFIIKIETFE